MQGSTTRFSNRVADYVKYRPGYPKQLLPALERMIGLTCDWRVADIGSGTGKLAELFLGYGCELTGVEPNKEMREAAEQLLSHEQRFTSVDATAEHTGLHEGDFDLVAAGQAFHWFDADLARVEFRRILSDRGWVALVWNDRQTRGTEFLEAYEGLLSSLPEYLAVGHKSQGEAKVREFFTSKMDKYTVPSLQAMDWPGLLGRALSSSYVPPVGEPGNEQFVSRLKDIFDSTQVDGKVEFLYLTEMFVGKVDAGL